MRLLFTASIWLVAVVGLIVSRRSNADRRSAAILMAAPFFVLAGQSYGGEGGLRIYLFALPGVLCLVVLALTVTAKWPRIVMTGLAIALLFPGFLVARWGNELSEMTRPAEIAGVRALYRIAPQGSTIVSITPQISWRFTDIGNYDYEPDNLDEFVFGSASAIAGRIGPNPHGGFVIITTAQLLYGEQAYGLRPDWGEGVEASLERSGLFRLVYDNPDTQIYEYEGGA